MEEYGHRCETRRKTAEQFRKASFWCWFKSLASCACTFESFRSKLCQFFKKRGYPDSAVSTGKRRALEIDREIALQTRQRRERIGWPLSRTPSRCWKKGHRCVKNSTLVLLSLYVSSYLHLRLKSRLAVKLRRATNRTSTPLPVLSCPVQCENSK